MKHDYTFPRELSVLIVEDDGLLADAYVKIIQHAGGKPVSVGLGEEALRQLSSRAFDIMLLDMRLPDISGIEVLELLRQQGLIKPSLVVVLSNNDDQETIVKAYSLGADRYVLKTWATPNDLLKMLNEAIANQDHKQGCEQ